MNIKNAWQDTLQEICESLDDAKHQLKARDAMAPSSDYSAKPVASELSPHQTALLIAEYGDKAH